MAPVAGMPPNSGVSRLAAPCAISSVFESWRSPVTPSATVAESRDSIAPSSAMVKATGNRLRITSQSIAGMAAAGNSARIVKRSPMVSTPSMPAYVRSAQTPAVSTTMATSDPGIRRENLGVRTISRMLPIPTARFAQLTEPKWRK